MLRKLIMPALAALAVAATPLAAGAAPPPPPRAEIPFANHGGVDDWRVVSDREIWFRDSHRRWFRAILFTPAIDLPYVERIGIDARPMGTLDKFGGIVVRGQHYDFRSFEAMPGPPPRRIARRH
ncbi:hypothetical protein ACFOD9_07825 [Novosphingobium bradum]|uniref:Uncharacterized protein n=1 Tax=Novosphingobium bradum TaxID=1737444 RepID=A0ABV7INF2_9SPHN